MEEQEKQSVEIIEPPAPRKFGGAQPGAGRPAGSLNKLSAKDILANLENTLGVPYAVQLALNYQQAIYGDDPHLKAKYDQMILNKVVADKIDITSAGQSIAPVIEIASQEIADYIEYKPS
jgi:hypothetical protein